MRNGNKKSILLHFTLAFVLLASVTSCGNEISEYRGERLDSYDRAYDNSIAGPQTIDRGKYRLEVTGSVETPLSLTYDEVISLPWYERVITLHCVEGWDETLLFTGVRLADVFEPAKPKDSVRTVIFYAADGYSSSLPYDFVVKKDILLAFKINGRDLDERRGFPFQVVAESKYGYKWVKWVTKVELIEGEYRGYWERRGYSNDADIKE